MKKKLFSLLLALCMVLTLLPVTAMAEQIQTVDEITLSQEAVQTLQARAEEISVCQQAETANAGGYYTDALEAAAKLRSEMVERKNAITIPVQIPVSEMENTEQNMNLLALALLALAVNHTGVPTEGDYLLCHTQQVLYQVNGTYDAANYYLDLSYSITYYLNSSYEQSLKSDVTSLMSDFGFTEETSEYAKVKSIYDYVCSRTKYDTDGSNGTWSLTAYGALVSKKAVAQGYAALMYRLLLEAGVDARVVTGKCGGKDHVWNIVKLGDKYYNLDSAMDAEKSSYRYFLKSAASFTDHIRAEAYTSAEFVAAYPMATADYSVSDTEVIQTGKCGDDAVWTLYNNRKLVISGTGATYNYAYDEVPWYGYRHSYDQAEVQSGITAIGSGNFSWSLVENVSLPDTLEAVGPSAFSNCYELTRIVIPDNVTIIRGFAFDDCRLLSDVTLSSKLIEIGQNAFSFCGALDEITLPATLTTIGGEAFEGTALTEIRIPQSVKTIGERTFNGCAALVNVELPDTLERIEREAFAYCKSLPSIDLPDTLTYLGDGAFKGCEALYSISIPGGVTTVSDSAFCFCKGLRQISLGNGVQVIGNRAFEQTAIEEVSFPASLTEIRRDAFKYTYARNIYFKGDAPRIMWGALGSVTGYYPCNNTTWTEQQMRQYRVDDAVGDSTKWMAVHNHVERVCTFCGHIAPFFDGAIRIAGSTRYDTAFKSADALKEQLNVEKFPAAIVTSGENFADALAGSYLAYVKNAPILLTNNRNIGDVMDYICENVAEGGTVYALGGPTIVSDALTELEDDGYSFKRLYGASRFETNLEILKECGDIAGEDILVCTAYNFADSLSASAAKRPILLVSDSLTAEQTAFLSQLQGSKYYLIGGVGAVSTTVEQQLYAMNRPAITRLAGDDRYHTSALVAKAFYPTTTSAVLAYAQNFPDGLCAGPLAAALDAPLLLVDSSKYTRAVRYTEENPLWRGAVLGGPTLISDLATARVFKPFMSENDPIKNY